MALLFDGTTTKVDCGSNAVLDNLNVGTFLAWVYPTNVSTSARVIVIKGLGASGRRALEIRDLADGDLRVQVARATTTLEARSQSGVVTANEWQFLGTGFDANGVDADQELYRGTLGSSVAEISSYAAQSVGSGATGDNSAKNQFVGNRETDNQGFVGRIAWVGMWNRKLTLEEIRAQQFRPHVTSGNVFFMHVGFNGTGTQPDWSGNLNNGTVTAATVVDHVPLPLPFAYLGGWLGPRSAALVTRTLNGSITPAGTLVRQVQKPLAGAVTPVGNLVREVMRILAGSITPAGGIDTARTVVRALSGSITPQGIMTLVISLILGGSITPAASFTQQVSRLLAGTVTPSGALQRLVSRSLSGSLSPSGSLVRSASLLLGGSLSPIGTLLRQVQHYLAGSITPTGSVSLATVILRALSGSIAPTGTLVKSITRRLVGTLVPAGTVAKQIARSLNGSISLSGALTRLIITGGAAIAWWFRTFILRKRRD